jgi:hypothetical protein
VNGALARESVTRRRAVGWGLVGLGLVTIVAMEANGAAWSEHRGAQARSLPDGVVVVAAVGAGLLGVVLVVLLLATARAVETPEQRRRRWTTAIAFLAVIAFVSIVVMLVHPSHPANRGNSAPTKIGPSAAGSGNGDRRSDPTWWPLVIVGLGTVVAFATAIAARPRVGPTTETDTDVDDANLAMLDASLDDLRREPDPRRAVTAAYARTERGLAARGFARKPSETPTEYLQRALARRDQTPADQQFGVELLGELTELAERSRFSALAIDETMRSSAIGALEKLRRQLRREARADVGPVG